MILISLTLAIAGLACLRTSPGEYIAPFPTSAVTVAVDEDPAGAVYEVDQYATAAPDLSLDAAGEGARESCAVVIAVVALHLRAGPSEGDIVLGWLRHGDRLRVLDRSYRDWWLVDFNGRTGYARSSYLADSECE